MKSALFSTACIFLIAVSTFGQTSEGSIKGTVSDSHGALIPGVKVALITHPENQIRQTITGAKGEFSFLEVPIGDYELRVKVAWFGRKIRKRTEIRSGRPNKVDLIISLEGCSDENEGGKTSKLEVADHAEIVRALMSLHIGDAPSRPSSTPSVIFSPENFSPGWLTPEQRSRVSIISRLAIQELTEKSGALTYYSFTKPIKKGNCVGISILTNVTVKGQLENANMAGGADLYELRKVNGKWEGLLLSSMTS